MSLCVYHSPPPLPLQPNYPVVLPIWHTDCIEPFVISLTEEMNMSDEASAGSSHPVSHFVIVCHFLHNTPHIIVMRFIK